MLIYNTVRALLELGRVRAADALVHRVTRLSRTTRTRAPLEEARSRIDLAQGRLDASAARVAAIPSSSTSTKATRNRPIWLNTEPTWRSGSVAPKTRWRSWCKRSTYWPDRMTPGLWPAFWCWVCAPVGTWNPEREPFRQLTGGEELRSSSPCHDSCDPALLAQPRRPALPTSHFPDPRASRGGRPARHSRVRGLQDQYRPIWITAH